jgi:peptidoglycan/LPS O-acetylase OafA/YrhL
MPPFKVGTRYPNLDLLRLVLAVEVVIGHSRIPGVPEWINPVPAFVCLSGLLIPGSFETSNGWGHFAWKRLLRVGPAFALALGLVMALFGPLAALPTLLCYVTLGIVQVGMNGVLWSLMVEEILYASHAVMQIRKWWNAEAVAVLLCLCILVCSFHLPNLEDRLVRAAAAYFMGNLFYFNLPKIERIPWPVYAVGAVWAIGWSRYPIGRSMDLPYNQLYGSASPLHLPLLLLSVGFVVLAARQIPQVKIGKMPDLSYGTYIYHKPLLLTFSALGFAGWELAWVGLGSTLALAVLSWYLVEDKALKWKNSPPTLSRRRAKIEVMGAA